MADSSEFESICPYNDAEAVEALNKVANHPAVLAISEYLFPDEPIFFLRNALKSVHNIDEFQEIVMNKAVSWVMDNTIHNFSYDGISYIKEIKGKFLAMSNHRDIILDPAITQQVLFRNGIPMTEICVGDNLIKQSKTVEYLLRSNRMIRVIRGISARELYLSSQILSKYIRQTITSGKADNVKFYTRLWPVGSSRNIDAATYGHSRLQLPDGKRYVEVNADKYGRVDHYEAEAFADIYPRRTGTISSVRSEVKKGEDGNDFTIYYFKDNNLPFSPNEYEIGGLVKRVSFQEGSELGGLGDEEDGTYYFEVNYDDKTEEFEIITIWPYDNDMQLPGGSLVPKVGDKYILWNIRMPEEYYRIAEEEFGQAVDKYNQEHALDVSVFKSSTDHVWVENEAADLYVGRRVHLESKQYFPETGYRDSRITKITRKVNLPSSLELEIGDTLGRTAREKIRSPSCFILVTRNPPFISIQKLLYSSLLKHTI